MHIASLGSICAQAAAPLNIASIQKEN